MFKKVKRITLVESFKTRELADRPDLGVALLVGTLRRSGYDVINIGGQENYLPQILNKDAEEIMLIAEKHHSEKLFERFDLADFYKFAKKLKTVKFKEYLGSLEKK